MGKEATGPIVRQIEVLLDSGSAAGVTDTQLLVRFNTRRDPVREVAFAAIVTRHGPMVLHVCREILGDRHHAKDAFQAVFLVLARKAETIRDPELLDNWLYGVAVRTARKAKVSLARRRKNEEGTAMRYPRSGSSVPVESTLQHVGEPALSHEQAEMLHEEIDRLPRSFRLPVVHHYFEGLTLDEAARRLRWPAGTVRSRLARARQKLRRNLIRRGVVLSTGVLAEASSQKPISACLSSPLSEATIRAAIRFVSGRTTAELASSPIVVLAREVLQAILFQKLKLTAMSLLLLGSVATGAGYLTHFARIGDEPKLRLIESGQPPLDRSTSQVPRRRAGCSSSAASSTRKETRCRMRRQWPSHDPRRSDARPWWGD